MCILLNFSASASNVLKASGLSVLNAKLITSPTAARLGCPTFADIEAPAKWTHFPDLRENLRDEMLFIVDNNNASQFELLEQLYMFVDIPTRSAENACVISTCVRQSHTLRAIISVMLLLRK